uniref:Uncharacterized protein n=1 Tax=Mycena chlorophos TaxID=658473 RepID=A0ABQ0KX31_MYCCL|nr:predicted protein [Mycena chlorophos]
MSSLVKLENLFDASFSPRPLPHIPHDVALSVAYPPGAGSSGSSSSSASSIHNSPPLAHADTIIVYCPQIPDPDCPIRLVRNAQGRLRFDVVSHRALRVDHPFVLQIVCFRIDPSGRCSHCAEFHLRCDFSSGWGVCCGGCHLLGSTDCEHSDREVFLINLREFRDRYLHDHWRRVEADLADGLPASLVKSRYEEGVAWFHRGAQGAINRFEMLREIVRPLARRGYADWIDATDDTAYLSRCLSHAIEHGLHPRIRKMLSDRISFLSSSPVHPSRSPSPSALEAVLGEKCIVKRLLSEIGNIEPWSLNIDASSGARLHTRRIVSFSMTSNVVFPLLPPGYHAEVAQTGCFKRVFDSGAPPTNPTVEHILEDMATECDGPFKKHGLFCSGCVAAHKSNCAFADPLTLLDQVVLPWTRCYLKDVARDVVHDLSTGSLPSVAHAEDVWVGYMDYVKWIVQGVFDAFQSNLVLSRSVITAHERISAAEDFIVDAKDTFEILIDALEDLTPAGASRLQKLSTNLLDDAKTIAEVAETLF